MNITDAIKKHIPDGEELKLTGSVSAKPIRTLDTIGAHMPMRDMETACREYKKHHEDLESTREIAPGEKEAIEALEAGLVEAKAKLISAIDKGLTKYRAVSQKNTLADMAEIYAEGILEDVVKPAQRALV